MPRTSLNNIQVIPSPNNSSEEEERPTLNVVTRAQSLRDKDTQTRSEKESDKKTPKRRHRQRGSKEGKKKKTSSEESDESEKKSKESSNANKPRENKEPAQTSTEPSEGGSVVIDKVHEHLQAALDAYNSRITSLTEIPKKLQEYPNPREEKVNLSLHQ